MELSKKYLKLVNKAKERIKEISIDDTIKIMKIKDSIKLIDIREESEWSEKRIPKAIYIGKGILEREIENAIPNTNTKIILYCGGGYRSALAAENLQTMGYKNVYSMIGGITEWEEKGLPVVNT
jgi:rhodanese-related sulfurtransferase